MTKKILTTTVLFGILATSYAYNSQDLAKFTQKKACKGCDLRGISLENTNLQESDLSGSDLRGAQLAGADLKSSILNGCDFRGACLDRTNLENASLCGIDLRGTTLDNVFLRDADMYGADVSSVKSAKNALCFMIQGLTESQAEFLRDKGAIVSRKENLDLLLKTTKKFINEKEVCKKQISGAPCESEDVLLDYQLIPERGHLEGANLENTDLNKAKLGHVHFEMANLKGVNFNGAILLEAHFENADLSGANLTAASIRGARFKGCNLKDVKGLNSIQKKRVRNDGALNVPK